MSLGGSGAVVRSQQPLSDTRIVITFGKRAARLLVRQNVNGAFGPQPGPEPYFESTQCDKVWIGLAVNDSDQCFAVDPTSARSLIEIHSLRLQGCLNRNCNVRGVPGGDGLVDPATGPYAVDYGVSWLRHWVATPCHTQMLRVSSFPGAPTSRLVLSPPTAWHHREPSPTQTGGDTARRILDRFRIIADHGDSCRAHNLTSVAGQEGSPASSKEAACS